MNTKYVATFTEDNQVVFQTDLQFSDSYSADIPPTILILTEFELEIIKDIIILGMMYSKFNTRKFDTLIGLNKKVYKLVL